MMILMFSDADADADADDAMPMMRCVSLFCVSRATPTLLRASRFALRRYASLFIRVNVSLCVFVRQFQLNVH
jgi:hypothetical protein